MGFSGALGLGLLLTACCAAQEQPALKKLTDEAARVLRAPLTSDDQIKEARERSATFQTALRNWLESQLPRTRASLDARFDSLGPKLHAILDKAGLIGPDTDFLDLEPGLVSRVELSRPKEDPNLLTVIAGVTIPCGEEDVVYIYDYGTGPPRRVLESKASRDHDEAVSEVRFSEGDGQGSRSILTLRSAVQCGSSWNGLSYDLFDLPAGSSAVHQILAGEHEIWFGASEPYQVRLQPHDLLMEIRDRSIDAGVHNRAHVLHYDLSGPTPRRVDPVALSPRDFVDEWLTRPWAEMESRSAEKSRDELNKWHDDLSGDFIAGEFAFVQACEKKAGEWQVGLSLRWMKGKELLQPRMVYFLMQARPEFHFQMTGISNDRQEGCPGQGDPSQDSPSLFPASTQH